MHCLQGTSRAGEPQPPRCLQAGEPQPQVPPEPGNHSSPDDSREEGEFEGEEGGGAEPPTSYELEKKVELSGRLRGRGEEDEERRDRGGGAA